MGNDRSIKPLLIQHIKDTMAKILDIREYNIKEVELLRRDSVGFKIEYSDGYKDKYIKVNYHMAINQISLFNGEMTLNFKI